MTNEQVTELLRAAQQFWKKYRDAVPNHDDAAAWDAAFREANAPLKGLPEYASHIMLFFWEELHARDMERGRHERKEIARPDRADLRALDGNQGSAAGQERPERQAALSLPV